MTKIGSMSLFCSERKETVKFTLFWIPPIAQPRPGEQFRPALITCEFGVFCAANGVDCMWAPRAGNNDYAGVEEYFGGQQKNATKDSSYR